MFLRMILIQTVISMPQLMVSPYKRTGLVSISTHTV